MKSAASVTLMLLLIFLLRTLQQTYNAFQWAGQPLGDLEPHLIHGSLGPPSQPPKQHPNQFSNFCRDNNRDKQIHKNTDHANPSVAIGRI